MALLLHIRLSDAQVAAIDTVTRLTDPRTGLILTVSRQEVVSSILDAWIAQHATPLPGSPAPALPVEEAPQTPLGDLAPVRTVDVAPPVGGEPVLTTLTPEALPAPTSTATTKRKPTATSKVKATVSQASAALTAQVWDAAKRLGTFRYRELAQTIGRAPSTTYDVLQRLITEGKVAKVGQAYHVVALQGGEGTRAPEPAAAPALAVFLPNKAELAVRVREMRQHHMSYPQIAQQFNTEQIPTLSGKGRWGNSSVVTLEKFGV